MNRRDFVKTAAVTGISTLFFSRIHGAEPAPETLPDLAAVRGGEPAQLLDAGLAALGGISRFVKPGQTVVIKPNIGWNKSPETAADTNPDLIGHLVALCLKAGAKSVQVFDHTCDKNWESCYHLSGIAPAVEKAGGTMICGNVKSAYIPVSIPNGKVLKNAMLFRAVKDCDVFNNVPVLKNHGGTKYSGALKNLMGSIWDRPIMHRLGVQQAIADWAGVRKPDLNIMDAYRAMQTGGPRGNAASVILPLKSLLISTDMVAMDTAGARMLGIDPALATHIALAAEQGLGQNDLAKVNIKKIALS